MQDKLYWPKSATLMETWFRLDAREMIDKEKDGDMMLFSDMKRQPVNISLLIPSGQTL